ncbi:MAG: Alpha/beta fold hydrolase [Cyanobacteriota bacterium erpe_2018_sw_21hr_WHONDRS-SW48-000092_B_bin.40]|nr:Alpha/beta fold hydrolase [Cyanobacteriota bacterium erpe_2018_sw_21hr_WHONDRS-SW48-000092_B_bin.40]
MILVSKSIVGLALGAVLGVSFNFSLNANAAESKALAEANAPSPLAKNDDASLPVDDSEVGSKQLHVPTKAAKTAPCLSWLPPVDVKPRVALLCIHGFSLHKGCYAAFGKEMAKNGIATYATDLRGFGELKDYNNREGMDFDGDLVDIKATLQQIHKNHPGLPVILLGESLGGAIALRAAALYPELISGLICAVPARDRFAMSDSEKKVTKTSVLNTITGDYSKPMDGAAFAAVQKISANEELRSEWKNDPLMRTYFSAKDFVQFDFFMRGNLEVAKFIKDMPVLFLQGTADKLIRPEGTWRLFERLATPNRQLVLSKNSEHLLFEENQFRADDVGFVTTWIDKNVSPLDPAIAISMAKLPVVASMKEYSESEIAIASASPNTTSTSTTTTTTTTTNSAPVEKVATLPPPPQPTEFKHRLASQSPQINFWIELDRNGKVFRCNNKMEFKTGDKIRFHLIPQSDGYAYLVMKAGTTGKSDVLFPNNQYGTQNYLFRGKDYPIPAVGWMEFDQHPGTEQLGLVFASEKVDVTPESLKNRTMTAFVSADDTGSKDLCPTRMKLSWDDPKPVMLPDDFSAVAQVTNSNDSSLVRLMASPGGMVSASISLLHGSNR